MAKLVFSQDFMWSFLVRVQNSYTTDGIEIFSQYDFDVVWVAENAESPLSKNFFAVLISLKMKLTFYLAE